MTGSDLMFYNSAGAIRIQGSSTVVTLTGLSTFPAGLTSDYKGMLIFQSHLAGSPA